MNQFLSSSSYDFANNVSATSLELMAEYKVSPTPENYQLWYTHSAESDLDLSRTLNGIISKKLPFSDELNKKLHDRFFSREKEMETVAETGVSFQKEIAKIVNIIKEVGHDTSAHTEELSSHIETLADFEGSAELKEVIKLVLADADKIREQSNKLESKLQESSSKIENLQKNLDNARLESRTDALTNISNRKFFDEKMHELMATYKNEKQEFCLVICDIDYFKKFNDTFGHQIGDQVLKVVAHVIKKEANNVGFPARYGGEEFAILLPKSNTEGGVVLADLIRKVISHKRIRNKNSGEDFGKITMSFGVASVTPTDNIESLIARADEALYLAKENGRNRVQCENDLKQLAVEEKATA